MEINDLTVNDDLVTVVRKCNVNFKNLAYSFSQNMKSQSRMDVGSLNKAIQELSGRIADVSNNVVPREVAKQIEALGIDDRISAEVARQIAEIEMPDVSTAYPPVGSYLACDSMPVYDGTEWEQVGEYQLSEESDPIPIWHRTV